MSLITSISGIRGTIGGKPGEGLTPIDTVKFTAAYAEWLKQHVHTARPVVVLGRDARISGMMVEQLVCGTLAGCGIDVILLGHASTPTVEIAVTELNADGGIILTASHNPKEWNALKLLNDAGEFLSAADGEFILKRAEKHDFTFAQLEELGSVSHNVEMNERHIDLVKKLDLVDCDLIRSANFRVAIDCVNSVGGIVIPQLLRELGVEEVIELYCEPNGLFPHNPEPLSENLTKISEIVREQHADVGFVVDPDVDRLAIISEDGTMFGEEYTLVAVADYVLSLAAGSTCSNLSSSRALRDITGVHGQKYFASAVGEVNVVEVMKKEHCVIGGEGNGGIIYPALHYGRDALVGIALFLTHLAREKIACSKLRDRYPRYEMIKKKISLTPESDMDDLLSKVKAHFKGEELNSVDGLKIDFQKGWVHLRKSNTEPIIRIYAEAEDGKAANELAESVTKLIVS